MFTAFRFVVLLTFFAAVLVAHTANARNNVRCSKEIICDNQVLSEVFVSLAYTILEVEEGRKGTHSKNISLSISAKRLNAQMEKMVNGDVDERLMNDRQFSQAVELMQKNKCAPYAPYFPHDFITAAAYYVTSSCQR